VSQLSELSKPFPAKFISQKPGKFAASYVAHDIIAQRLLEVLGPYSFGVVELIRDKTGEVVGCLASMTVTIDGTRVTITEIGDAEASSNKNDGAKAKDAASDAFKRCAMRLGCGLHLWAGDSYYLHTALNKVAGNPQPSERKADVGRLEPEVVAQVGERALPDSAAVDSLPPTLETKRNEIAARLGVLKEAKMPIADAWKSAGLPKLGDCSDAQLDKANLLILKMEQEPF